MVGTAYGFSQHKEWHSELRQWHGAQFNGPAALHHYITATLQRRLDQEPGSPEQCVPKNVSAYW